MTKSLFVLAVGFFLAWTPVLADCDDDGSNHLMAENCGFDAGITGWTQDAATVTWTNSDGTGSGAGPGAMSLVDTNSLGAEASRCFDINLPAGTYTFGGWGRTSAVTGAFHALTIAVGFFPQVSCGGVGDTANSQVLFPDTNWNLLTRTESYGIAAQSVRVTILCDDFAVTNEDCLADNLFLFSGTTGVPVELQHFSVE